MSRIEVTVYDASMLASRKPAKIIRARARRLREFFEVVMVGRPDARRLRLGRELAELELRNRLSGAGAS